MSLKVVQFKSLGAVSYSPSVVLNYGRICTFVIYLASKNGLTSKTGLGFVQGHWKWHIYRSHTNLNT